MLDIHLHPPLSICTAGRLQLSYITQHVPKFYYYSPTDCTSELS